MKKEVREDIKIIKYAITFIFVIYAVVSMYEICFNPCFNGYYTFTVLTIFSSQYLIAVSILVLMDITLLHIFYSFNCLFKLMFQSLF